MIDVCFVSSRKKLSLKKSSFPKLCITFVCEKDAIVYLTRALGGDFQPMKKREYF